MITMPAIMQTAWNATKSFCNKHSSLIFGILGVGGVAATAVTSSIAGKNALIALNDYAEEHDTYVEDLDFKTKVEVAWTEYIWAGLVAGATAGTIILGNVVSAKKAAALSAALLVTQNQLSTTRDVFKDYYDQTIKYVPQNEAELDKVQKIIEKRPISAKEDAGKSVLLAHGAEMLHFIELDTGYECKCRWVDYDNAINQANSVINEQGFCSINTFHEFLPGNTVHLNTKEPEIGFDIGWQSMISYEPDAGLITDENGIREVVVYVVFNKAPGVCCPF